jgi:hypothetical protein
VIPVAELHEILDHQLASHAHEALDEMYQTGAVSTADLPTFEESFRDLLSEKGALGDAEVETIVSAVSNEISTNHGASPVDFITRSLYPEKEAPARHFHEESGLYYDEDGNWYDQDGTPSAYVWSAEHSLFYDASGNWYNADLSAYLPPAEGAPARHFHEESGLYYDEDGNWYDQDGTPSAYVWSAEHSLFYDATGNWYNADLSPYRQPEVVEAAPADPVETAPAVDEAVPAASGEALPEDVEEALSEMIDAVFEKMPEAVDLTPEQFAELFEQALLRSSEG